MSSAVVSLHMRHDLLRAWLSVHTGETLYVALTRTVAVANATGAQLDEPVGAGYARAAYPIDAEHFELADTAELRSTAEVIFPAAEEGGWGFCQGYALCTDSTSGMTWSVGRLTSPTPVPEGMVIGIPAGAIAIGLED